MHIAHAVVLLEPARAERERSALAARQHALQPGRRTAWWRRRVR